MRHENDVSWSLNYHIFNCCICAHLTGWLEGSFALHACMHVCFWFYLQRPARKNLTGRVACVKPQNQSFCRNSLSLSLYICINVKRKRHDRTDQNRRQISKETTRSSRSSSCGYAIIEEIIVIYIQYLNTWFFFIYKKCIFHHKNIFFYESIFLYKKIFLQNLFIWNLSPTVLYIYI